MGTVTLALIAIAIIGIAYMLGKHNKALSAQEEIQMKLVASLTNVKKDLEKRMDDFVGVHNAAIDHYDDEIDQIIERMNKIVEDIARIDHDEKDIRTYYMNYREPVQKNGGVDWAVEFPDLDTEEEHEQNDA